MKKNSSPPQSTTPSPAGAFDLSTERPNPVCHMFTIRPNIDTESLLCHACETLASLSVMSTDLASDLKGSQRNLALAVQQLAVLGELLVNRALDNHTPLSEPPERPANGAR